MRRVRLMIGGLLMGALVGALAVWMGPGGIRQGAGGDPLTTGTRQVCEAILADESARWETVGDKYFAGNGRNPGLLKVARAQALYFGKGSRIASVRRSADGAAGDRKMVAVECRTEAPSGNRVLTLHWERKRSGPWRLTDLTSAAAAPEPATAQGIPAAGSRAADPESKPHPQGY